SSHNTKRNEENDRKLLSLAAVVDGHSAVAIAATSIRASADPRRTWRESHLPRPFPAQRRRTIRPERSAVLRRRRKRDSISPHSTRVACSAIYIGKNPAGCRNQDHEWFRSGFGFGIARGQSASHGNSSAVSEAISTGGKRRSQSLDLINTRRNIVRS